MWHLTFFIFANHPHASAIFYYNITWPFRRHGRACTLPPRHSRRCLRGCSHRGYECIARPEIYVLGFGGAEIEDMRVQYDTCRDFVRGTQNY